MAHYDAHKGRGYDGYGGRPAALMAYSTEERSSYMASSEQYVMYDGYTTRPDLNRNSVYPQLKKGRRLRPLSPVATFRACTLPTSTRPIRITGDDHPSAYGAHHGGHPRNNFGDGRGGSDDDSSDDEVECRDGVCYPEAQTYGKEKNKANGHAAGNYPVKQLYSEPPRKDPYHEPSNGAHAYSAPAHTKPASDAYYDRYSYPDDHNRNNYTAPAPIKTRPDLGDSGRGSPVAAMAQWTPFAASSPRKGHQGNAQPQSAPPMGRRGAIDCETGGEEITAAFL
ncbi:hypothetical protein SASPL_108949 [Salvia splendens]|uniref:Uncharacterized protein n=1 Tax=Salvia splendens TaxID=180675 RepID=A0A8X8YJ60_SALSN|nr:hypothetical protein SASPL_108949 [Salvia splendens]